MATNLDTFKNATAGRLPPDRASRWLGFWDTFSSTIPDKVTDAEYSDLTLSAWLEFLKQDENDQTDAIARAWGIKQFKKVPRLQPRAPKATVVKHAVKPWEPCIHWGGTRPCSTHEHKPLNGDQEKLGQDTWNARGNRGFVRKRIRAEILPYTDGNAYLKFDDLEASVWWTIAGRMRSYVPVRDQEGDVIPKAERGWLREVVHSAVIDHFRAENNKTRDARREILVEFDYDLGIPPPNEPMQAQSVRPKGTEPDGSDPNDEAWK